MNIGFDWWFHRRKLAVCLISAWTLFVPEHVVAATPSAPVNLTICSKTPYPLYVSLLYLAQETPVRWDVEGWWRLEAGTCTTLAKGVRTQNYYVFADSDDDVAKWLYSAPQQWTGSDVRACVWNPSAFRIADHRTCPQPPGSGRATQRGFKKVDTKGQDSTYTLWDTSFPVKTLEEAATTARILRGRMEYEVLVLGRGVKRPFHLGVTFKTESGEIGGVAVDQVFAGMPADEIEMRSGDRIFLVNDDPVSSAEEISAAIDHYGYSHDAPRWVRIGYLRGEDIVIDEVALEYFHELDPRRTSAGGWGAGITAGVDSALLGFSSQVLCWLESLLSDNFNYRLCVDNRKADLARKEEMYPEEYRLGDFGGMWISLTRGILSGVVRSPRLLGSRMLGRIAREIPIEAAETAVTIIGQARPGDTPEQIVERIRNAMPTALRVGAASGIMFK